MKLLLATFLALICLAYSHAPEKNSKCILFDKEGKVEYDLRRLQKFEGKPYSYADGNGTEWFFNICGDLEALDIQGCPKDAAVCKRTNNVTVNAGKTAVLSGNNQTNGIEIVYKDGDSCGVNGQRTTTFEFVCRSKKFPGNHTGDHKDKPRAGHQNKSKSEEEGKSKSEEEKSKSEDEEKSKSDDERKSKFEHKGKGKGKRGLVVKEVKVIDECNTIITVESCVHAMLRLNKVSTPICMRVQYLCIPT